MKKYLKTWWIFTINSFQTQLMVRWAVGIFLFSKIVRFAIFTFFIVTLLNNTKVFAGYTMDQVIFFFLSFNLIDMLSQLLFREVYRFRQAIVTGTFDFYLIKPLSPLFRSLLTGPDLIDLLTIIPLIGGIIFFLNRLGINNLENILLYLFLLGVAFVLSAAFHIFVLALAVVTTEIDSAILLFRDLTGMGRFPIDIYKEPIRGFLTFVIPVGIMMSFPVKSLLGLLSPFLILYALIFTLCLFLLSLVAWDYALKQYSSASS